LDLIRIFKAVITVFMIIVFLFLLFSAYEHYRFTVSSAGLVDATSTIANDLVLNDLAMHNGETGVAYVIDPTKINSLSLHKSIGKENFGYCVRISDMKSTWSTVDNGKPDNREACSIALPITLFENFRHVPGKIEVIVWRI